MPHIRGKRIKTIRKALRFTRPAFTKAYGVPIGTLQSWEDGRHNGVSEKGCKKLVKAFKAEGIVCTVEWIMYGIGDDPLANNSVSNNRPESKAATKAERNENNPIHSQKNPPPNTLPELHTIQEELSCFYQCHPNATHLLVDDDTLAPRFQKGDLVAGQQHLDKEIANCVGRDCIVHTVKGETLIRKVVCGGSSDTYRLNPIHEMHTTTNEMAHNQTHKEAQLFSAAPIIWIRRF